jgi:hypothetical protein
MVDTLRRRRRSWLGVVLLHLRAVVLGCTLESAEWRTAAIEKHIDINSLSRIQCIIKTARDGEHKGVLGREGGQ